MKVLLTSTSFQDNPGKHQDLLKKQNYEIDSLRGPISEDKLLDVISDYDAVLMGDDEFTDRVIKKGSSSRLKVLSKYGVGLDKVDLNSCQRHGVLVKNVQGVNHTTVAEHVFALILSYARNIYPSLYHTKRGEWKRETGFNLKGKRIGILGLGSIGKEVIRLSKAFGLEVWGHDKYLDNDFFENHSLKKASDVIELVKNVDILTLHLPLNEETKQIINKEVLSEASGSLVIVNTARGELVDEENLCEFLKEERVKAYLTDVLKEEPMKEDCRLRSLENVYITPHIASRTIENVEIQGEMAVNNLMKALEEFSHK